MRVSVGHVCEAEAPTEATAETSAPPEENEAITRRVILSLSNPKGAAGGISSAHKTKFSHRWTVISDQWSDGYRNNSGTRERNAECKMQNAELGKREKGKGDPQ